eukprot:COSAG04_NODE_1215_length_7713_cov_6.145127_2_plen_141_part_00
MFTPRGELIAFRTLSFCFAPGRAWSANQGEREKAREVEEALRKEEYDAVAEAVEKEGRIDVLRKMAVEAARKGDIEQREVDALIDNPQNLLFEARVKAYQELLLRGMAKADQDAWGDRAVGSAAEADDDAADDGAASGSG